MKKLISLALILALALAMPCAALAEGETWGERPQWMPEGLCYVTMPSDAAYGGEKWEKITQYRGLVEKGQDLTPELMSEWVRGGATVGWQIEMGYLLFRAGLITGDTRYFGKAGDQFFFAANAFRTRGGMEGDPVWNGLYLWRVLADVMETGTVKADLAFEAMCLNELTEDALFALPYMRDMDEAAKAELRAGLAGEKAELAKRVELHMDGYPVDFGDEPAPVIYEGRTMVPVRFVAERLGADVLWDPETNTATFLRAGTEVKMTLRSDVAYLNGEAVKMDVEPLNIGGRMLIPVRFMAEFFGQKVGWDDGLHRVTIVEDKTVADERLEQAVLAMGAYISEANYGDPIVFGMWRRGNPVQYYDPSAGIFGANPTATARDRARMILADSWGARDREGLISQIEALLSGGDDAVFRAMAGELAGMTEEERESYGLSYVESDLAGTEYLAEKWGERGIAAWDLFRVATLVQWGYDAGYVTYAEALELARPAVERLSELFDGWSEAMENYVDGYLWWDGKSEPEKETFGTSRGLECLAVMKNYPELFDDSLLA